MIKKALVLLSCVFIMNASFSGAAETNEFQFFEEEARVITASRYLQSKREVPMAVEIITSEDIAASGALNLWDLLRFRAGVDASDRRTLTGNRGTVAVRGFTGDFVATLQVLLDGRSVYNAFSGGVLWEQLPVQLQDIEQIEIVRGPNGALYGSNSGTGVINIITKKPSNKTAASVSSLLGSQGSVQTSESVESAGTPFQFRLSHTYNETDGFPDSFGNKTNDYLHSHKLNFNGSWKPSLATSLKLYSGSSLDKMGMTPGSGNGKFSDHFEMLKISHVLSNKSNVELLMARNDEVNNIPGGIVAPFDVRTYQYDVQFLNHIDWDRHGLQTTWGTDYRYSSSESHQFFPTDPNQAGRLYNGFLQQSYKPFSRVTLHGAFSMEHSDISGTDASASASQVAVVLNPWEYHTFRLSYAQAPTLPSIARVAGNFMITPVTRFLGNPDLRPQQVRSYEIGYLGKMTKTVSIEESLYYMDINDIDLFEVVSITGGVVNTSSVNSDSAIARGAETKLTYQFGATKSIFVNHTYETISDNLGNRIIIDSTSRHKLNVGGNISITRNLSASANAGYKSGYYYSDGLGTLMPVPAYWRLDLKLRYKIRNAEIFAAGQNLSRSRHLEYAGSNLVPRTYYGGVSLSWGAVQ